MHTHIATATDAGAGRLALSLDTEKIFVRRIRLRLSDRKITANVNSFFGADRVLLAWAAQARQALACEFEIVYEDGCTLAGDYLFRPKATTRPSLMRFILMCARRLGETGANGVFVRGLTECPHGFLDRYEVEDSSSG